MGRGLRDVSEIPSHVPKVPPFPFLIVVPAIPSQRLSHPQPIEKMEISFLISNNMPPMIVAGTDGFQRTGMLLR